MRNLLHLQNQFQDYLLDAHDEFKHHVISTEKVPAEIRLAIYRDAYHARLIDALHSNYPMLYEFLGTDLFVELASEYIQQYPSLQRSIRWFGDKFPAFLNHHSDMQIYPYLSELAEFEWIQTLVFDAADHTALTAADIQIIPPHRWQDLRFQVHPSVRRINFSWNIVSLWQAIAEDLPLEDPVKNPSPTAWVIWRQDLINHHTALADDEACALDAVLCGQSFGDMCEIIYEWTNENEAVTRAASLLNTWINLGLFSELQLVI